MKCHYEGTGVFEGLCLGTKECDSCIGYERCTAFKSEYKTNADRIRAMSDEELADEFMRFFAEVLNINTDGYWSFSDDFRDELLEHLRQPVKDGENG